MLGRFIVLNTIGAGLLVAAHLMGVLPVLLSADKFFAVPIIGGLTLVGLGMMAVRRTEGALWLADKLPVVGLALTVIGLLWASNGDLEGLEFKRDIIHALVGNLMGVMGFAWLELTARVCR
jgi:hypothetical protein